jgi:hypothetical protein
MARFAEPADLGRAAGSAPAAAPRWCRGRIRKAWCGKDFYKGPDAGPGDAIPLDGGAAKLSAMEAKTKGNAQDGRSS